MRITLITQYYPPERGSVRYGWHLAKGLTTHGHDVTVIAGLPHFPIGKPYAGYSRVLRSIKLEDGIRVIRVPLVMGSNRQTVRRILGFVTFSCSALAWAIRGSRPDVMIASVPPATSALSGLIASWIRHCPYVVVLRDIEPWRALRHRGLSASLRGRALIGLFMWVYRRARRVVVMHQREMEVLVAAGIKPERIEVIPHGVDPAWFASSPTTASCVIPRRPERSLFLYCGTIGLVHGLTDLLRTLADPRIRLLPIDLAVVGDGQYRQECARIVHSLNLDNVSIYDPVTPEEVEGLMAQANVLVCSFRNDDDIPLCSKFYEYCAAGKPILVYGSNVAGDLVTEIGNGLNCRAGDADSLLAVLTEFLRLPDEWRRRGDLGRAYAKRNFSQTKRDEQWEKVLTTVASCAGHRQLALES